MKKSYFKCHYEITNDNWERIKTGSLCVCEENLDNAKEHFHDLMLDLMVSVDGADDYFLSNLKEVA